MMHVFSEIYHHSVQLKSSQWLHCTVTNTLLQAAVATRFQVHQMRTVWQTEHIELASNTCRSLSFISEIDQ